MEKEQAFNLRAQEAGKMHFVQNDLFEYWTSHIEEINNDLFTQHSEPITGYLSQLFDPFQGLDCDSSPGMTRKVLELLHADKSGIALIGGSGTGKTQLLASLAGYWIQKNIFRPREVLVISFTDSEIPGLTLAISEVIGQTGTGDEKAETVQTGTEVYVTGLEGFCLKLLSSVYGYTPSLFDLKDRQHFITLIFPFLSDRNIELLCANIKFSEIKSDMEGGEDFQHLRETYINSLINIRACDRDTLVFQAAQVVTSRPDILLSIRQKYKCILIDDIQCMDKDQYNFISQVIMQTLFLESDPDSRQTIVVSMDPLQGEKNRYMNHVCEIFLSNFIQRRIVLNKSWRVPRRILQSVARVYGKEKAKKKKLPGKSVKRGTHILLFRAKNPGEEARFIVNTILSYSMSNIEERDFSKRKIEELNLPQGYSWKDFGIFSRNKQNLEQIIYLLNKTDIPYFLHNQKSFTRENPFHLINSLFRFLLSERDITAFVDILLNLLTGFSISEVQGIFMAGNRKDEPLPGLILRLYNEHVLSDSQYTGIVRLFKVCKDLKTMVFKNGIAAGIIDLCREFPVLEEAFAVLPAQRECFLKHAYSCGTDLVKFLSRHIHNNVDSNRIHLSPFHLVKGLEVPVLFISGMEEGNCPMYTGSPDMELEAGLFYSAITRVKEIVYLSYSESRSGEKMMMSSFIREMGPHVKEITPDTVLVNEYKQEVLF